MRDDRSPLQSIMKGILIAFAVILVAISLFVGLFFGICSMIRP